MKHVKMFESFLNEGAVEKEMHVYEIVCRDPDGTLKEILDTIMAVGNTGHSFDVVVDPEEKEKLGERTFNWDGDGSDYIKEVKVIQTPVKTKDEKTEEDEEDAKEAEAEDKADAEVDAETQEDEETKGGNN